MIAVTGGTGTIGEHLVRILAGSGVEARALTRHPDAQEALPGIEWIGADLADRRLLAERLDGVEVLFLLTGNSEDMVALQKNAIRAAGEAGVRRVVKLSALGATDHSRSVIGLWHYNVERRLRESGMAWTILRPHHFMQNLLDPLVFDRAAGRVRSASGEGAIPFIDTRDIAEAAAVALSGEGHEGEVYTLTGAEARSYREATEVLARVLDRTIEYVPEEPDEAWRRLRSTGLPEWRVAAMLAIAAYQRQGGATERVTDTVDQLTGRPPRSLEDFARDHMDALRTWPASSE